jgi:tight adherence protein B
VILIAGVLMAIAAVLAAGLLRAGWARFRAAYAGPLLQRSAGLGSPVRLPIGLPVLGAIGVGLLLGAMSQWLLAAPAAALALAVPRWLLAARVATRERLVRDQFGDVVTAVAALVRSGREFRGALAAALPETPVPARDILADTVRGLNGNLSLDQALTALRDRLRMEAVTLFVATALACDRAGGRMAGALDAVAEGVRERQRLERKAAVETASGRQQVLFLASFPVVFLVLMTGLFPAGTGALFGSVLGQVVLLVAAALVVGGTRLGMRIVSRAV